MSEKIVQLNEEVIKGLSPSLQNGHKTRGKSRIKTQR